MIANWGTLSQREWAGVTLAPHIVRRAKCAALDLYPASGAPKFARMGAGVRASRQRRLRCT
jgi:hypothetical protein